MTEDCIFCKIARGDIPAERVYEDEETLAFRDINPAAPVHVLVIPKRHIATATGAAEGDAPLLGKLLLAANAVARQEGIAEAGARYVLNVNRGAGQEVFHIHLHVLGGRTFSWPPG
jgi:histidine triad (HIT) family protein